MKLLIGAIEKPNYWSGLFALVVLRLQTQLLSKNLVSKQFLFGFLNQLQVLLGENVAIFHLVYQLKYVVFRRSLSLNAERGTVQIDLRVLVNKVPGIRSEFGIILFEVKRNFREVRRNNIITSNMKNGC